MGIEVSIEIVQFVGNIDLLTSLIFAVDIKWGKNGAKCQNFGDFKIFLTISLQHMCHNSTTVQGKIYVSFYQAIPW